MKFKIMLIFVIVMRLSRILDLIPFFIIKTLLLMGDEIV